MLHIRSFTFNTLEEKTYVVYDDTQMCVIIDPGCYEAHEWETLRAFIEEQGLQVTHLINTHAHIDHIVGNHYVHAMYRVPLALHRLEVPILHAAIQYATHYGFENYKPVQATKLLEDSDSVSLGNTSLSVLHVPGHSPGHIALYHEQDKVCFSGDVLFRRSIGRTDLLGGDSTLLLQSIRKRLLLLGDDVKIYPGHGPTTTIGEEKRHNPFY